SEMVTKMIQTLTRNRNHQETTMAGSAATPTSQLESTREANANIPGVSAEALAAADPSRAHHPALIELKNLNVHYGDFHAVHNVNLTIPERAITAMIGPSGCGKSTVLRSINRMNDLIPGARVSGRITYHGQDIYGSGVDPIAVRRHIGMVFQKANPFPKSIYDNVAYGLRINGMTDGLADRVERALRGAALWDEVKDNLKKSALALSGGQQQRLCIARAIAVE